MKLETFEAIQRGEVKPLHTSEIYMKLEEEEMREILDTKLREKFPEDMVGRVINWEHSHYIQLQTPGLHLSVTVELN